MEIIFNQIRQIIETKFTNKLPTVDQIYSEADTLREVFKALYPVTDEEFESIKKRLPENILHSIGYADTLRKRDSAHQYGWYKASVNDGFFGIDIKTICQIQKMEQTCSRKVAQYNRRHYG